MTNKILVVDDDKDFAKLIILTLRGEGYTLQVTHQGEEAIKIAREWRPDLILLDVMMPGLSGYAVAHELQKNVDTADIPIMMLTAKASHAAEIEGLGSGAVDYITKPYNIDLLKERIRSQLRYRSHVVKEENGYQTQRLIALPMVSARRRSGLFHVTYRISKRIFDFVVVILVMPFALPLMALCALAVRIDSPGQVVFTQQRTGRNGSRFKMYKFRTMYQNAEELKQKYLHLNELTWPDFKITNDPRVTKVGKFLRRTSLDELPQLFNILKGDMSIVGPRPTSFDSSTYQLWHTERLEVIPGLTGLWQVAGRAEIDFDDRVELDIEYIERQCWALDILIIWRTFSAVFKGRGAH